MSALLAFQFRRVGRNRQYLQTKKDKLGHLLRGL